MRRRVAPRRSTPAIFHHIQESTKGVARAGTKSQPASVSLTHMRAHRLIPSVTLVDERPQLGRPIRPTRAEIDLGAVVDNCIRLKHLVGDPDIYAVVKADAYGHGAVPVARALVSGAPIAGLAVSLAEEGLELRRGGVRAPVLVMGGVYAGAHRDLVGLDLTPLVSDLGDVEAFADAASSMGTRARIHVKLDTGMSRLGVRPAGLAAFLDGVAHHPEVEITGFCTHLASADSDPELTNLQLDRFEAAIPLVRRHVGEGDLVLHAANSAGTLNFRRAHYDAVRPGLALYCGTDPAMRFVTAIAQLHDLEAGDTVSYGALWRAPGRARVATLPVGYADGYPRRLTGSGEVLVRGRRCPVVGAVCMDMTMIDVTALGERGGGRRRSRFCSAGRETSISPRESSPLARG